MAVEISHSSGVLNGTIDIQGSKSISNRVILLSDLYALNAVIAGSPSANDTIVLKKAVLALQNSAPEQLTTIDAEDAGTVCRFILPFLAFLDGEFILNGTERMAQRPLKPLIDALRQLGAVIHGDQLPLRIEGKLPDRKDVLSLNVDTSSSSQFASALLMIMPRLANSAELILTGSRLSMPYIDMTIRVMQEIGFNVSREGAFIRYNKSPLKTGKRIEIEPDYSSIAFWVGITALAKGGQISVNARNFDQSMQGDRVIIERAVQNRIIRVEDDGERLVIRPIPDFKGIKVVQLDYSDTPDLAIPELIMYLSLGFRCHFTGIDTLDYKESPRFTLLKERLALFGINVRWSGKEYVASGNFQFPQETVVIDPVNDHRLAMGFAMIGIRHPIIISHPEVVSKSYPGFWDDLRKVNFDVIELKS